MSHPYSPKTNRITSEQFKLGDKHHTTTASVYLSAFDLLNDYPVWLKQKKEKNNHLALYSLDRELRILQSVFNTAAEKPITITTIDSKPTLVIKKDPDLIPLSAISQKTVTTITNTLTFGISLFKEIDKIHKKNIIHCLLSTQTILCSENLETLSMIGFDRARFKEQNIPLRSPDAYTMGLANYLAPELSGYITYPIDYRADYYSAGIILYELLTKQAPYLTSNITEILTTEPILPTEINIKIPIEVSKIIIKLLQKIPDNRYQTIFGVIHDLESAREALTQRQQINNFTAGAKDLRQTPIYPRILYGRNQQQERLDHILTKRLGSSIYGFCESPALPSSGRQISQESAPSMLRPVVIFLEGAPGTGRTRFLADLSQRLHYPLCNKLNIDLNHYCPSKPTINFINGLESLFISLKTLPKKKYQRLLDNIASRLSGLYPVFCQLFADVLIKEKAEHNIQNANAIDQVVPIIIRVIEALSIEIPLIITADNFHQIDAASHGILSNLFIHRHNDNLILIATTDKKCANPHLLEFKSRLHEETLEYYNISLENLSDDVCQQIIKSIIPKLGNSSFSRNLFSTARNEELNNPKNLFSYINKEIIQPNRDDTGSTSHLCKIPSITLKLLQKAALLGQTFNIAHLSQITSISEGAILEYLEPVSNSDMLINCSTQNQLIYRFANEDICVQLIANMDNITMGGFVHHFIHTWLPNSNPRDIKQLKKLAITSHLAKIYEKSSLDLNDLNHNSLNIITQSHLQLGRILLKTGSITEALDFFHRALRFSSSLPNLHFEAQLLQIRCWQKRGLVDKATNTCFDLFQSASDGLQQVKTTNLLAQLYLESARYQDALSLCIDTLKKNRIYISSDISNIKIIFGYWSQENIINKNYIEKLFSKPRKYSKLNYELDSLLIYSFFAAFTTKKSKSIATLVIHSIHWSKKNQIGSAGIVSLFLWAKYLAFIGKKGKKARLLMDLLMTRFTSDCYLIDNHAYATLAYLYTIAYWHRDLEVLQQDFENAFKEAQITGDHSTIGFSAYLLVEYLLIRGTKLPIFFRALDEIEIVINRYNSRWSKEVNDFGQHITLLTSGTMQSIKKNEDTTDGPNTFSYFFISWVMSSVEDILQQAKQTPPPGSYIERPFGNILHSFLLGLFSRRLICGLYSSTTLKEQDKRSLKQLSQQSDMDIQALHQADSSNLGPWMAVSAALNECERLETKAQSSAKQRYPKETDLAKALQLFDEAHRICALESIYYLDGWLCETGLQFCIKYNLSDHERYFGRMAYFAFLDWGASQKFRLLASYGQSVLYPHDESIRLTQLTASSDLSKDMGALPFLQAAIALHETQSITELTKNLLKTLSRYISTESIWLYLEPSFVSNEDVDHTNTQDIMPKLQLTAVYENHSISFIESSHQKINEDISIIYTAYSTRERKTTLVTHPGSSIDSKLLLALPMYCNNKSMGVIALNCQANTSISSAKLSYLEAITQQCALAFEKIQLTVNTEKVNEVSLKSSADLADALTNTSVDEKVREQFIDNISTELRKPLSDVIDLSQSILSTCKSEEIKDILSLVYSSSKSLQKSIDNLLDLGMLRNSKLQPNIESFDVAQHVESIIQESHENPSHYSNDIVKFSYIWLNKPKFLVRGDKLILAKCLDHVISNAFKFTSSGSIDIQLNWLHDTLKVSIKDTGKGISSVNLSNLFKPLVQGDISLNKKHGGLGIGLAIVKGYCSLVGGKIHVTSETDIGTTVTLEFPLPSTGQKLTPQVKSRYSQEEKQLQSDTNTAPQTKTSKHLLVAEDNIVNQKMLVKMLKLLGYTATTTENGQEAVDIFTKNPDEYIAILMDCQMPVMNGLEATRAIRQIEQRQQRRNIPIIAVTANNLEQQCLEAGMNGFLSKPLSRTVLQSKLKDITDNY